MPSFLLTILSALFYISASSSVAGRSTDVATNHILAARTTTGDSSCSEYMCVNATRNGDVVEYVLSSTGKKITGWMAVGFGVRMPHTPMVIIWPNSDGSITLSQRQTAFYSMPEVVPDPPWTATLSNELSTTSENGKYVFTIPWDGSNSTKLIWAFGTDHPESSAVDAPLQFHLASGHAHVDLSKPLTQDLESLPISTAEPSKPSSSTGASKMMPTNTNAKPFSSSQRLAFAHAIFCTAGFLLFLPAGVLASRWFRTFSTAWYTAHWILQLVSAGPAIAIGVAFGVQSVNKNRFSEHLNDDHKNWGTALFVFYIFQCILGAFIHWVKPKNSSRKPVQNYMHAIFGLILVGLGFYQVRSGYSKEWLLLGRGDIIENVDFMWYAWVALLSILYLAGLVLLPKQFRQEKVNLPKGKASVSPNGEQSQSSPLLAESSEVEEIGMQQVYRD